MIFFSLNVLSFAGYPPTPNGFSELYEKSTETCNYKFYFVMIIKYYLAFYSEADQNYFSPFDYYL